MNSEVGSINPPLKGIDAGTECADKLWNFILACSLAIHVYRVEHIIAPPLHWVDFQQD